jgi:hypothetical protein
MHKIIVQLPTNRDCAGVLEIKNAAGKRIAGPFQVCGRADDERAQANKNPARNPLLPFGDTPLGRYQVVKIIGSGPGTPYGSDEFGAAGLVLLQPKQGDAALADANGRFGFFIQGGARSRNRLLRPTQDGSLRLSDRDQRKFISALRRLGEANNVCIVICTAKSSGKVAVAANVPAVRTGRSASSSLLLASSVVASLVTGTIRQALLRTALHGAGASIASSGLVLLAQDHASAQPAGGDYNPTGGGAMDQLNTVEHNSQDAAHASTDEEAHDKAAQGFDTPSSVAPPVDLHDKQETVNPDAASGETPPASAAGVAPGSPIVAPSKPSSTPVETPETPEVSPTEPPPNSTEITPAPEATAPQNEDMQEEKTSTGNANQPTMPTQEEMRDAVAEPSANPTAPNSSTALENQNKPEEASPLENANQSAPTAQEPAAKALTDHESEQLSNPTPAVILPTTSTTTPSDFEVKPGDATANSPTVEPPSQRAPQNLNPDPRAIASADYATENAISHDDGSYGDQKCATYVTEALANNGIKLNMDVGGYRKDGHGYAKNLGPILADAGFKPVFAYDGSKDLDIEALKPQKGDVVVIQSPGKNNPAGHTAIFNGRDWVSDFVQDDQRVHPEDESGGLYPGKDYRNNHPAFQIYRLQSPPNPPKK